MNETDDILKKRLLELARRADERGICTYSQFLDMNGLSLLMSLRGAISPTECTAFGGVEQCERKVARFGAADRNGGRFPIVCLRIAPRSSRYADALTHRDFLGALMNLGVKRETLGDIFLSGSTGYLFCLDTVAPFIAENLTRVCRTDVDCEVVEELPSAAAPVLTAETVQLAHERLDALIARAYHLSREDSAELFTKKLVFVNSALCENSSRQPKPGEVISVRGFGRFIYRGVTGTSKKGKLNALIEKYSG